MEFDTFPIRHSQEPAMHRCLAAIVLFLSLATQAWAEQGNVELKQKDNTVDVTIDGKPFTTLQLDKAQAKPYFYPVLAADGAMICRQLENPEDHPHHKGIWCSIDEVNGIKFWAEKGKIVNDGVSLVSASGNPAKIKVVNHWLGEDGKPVVIETAEYSIFANRLVAYDATFTASEKPVTFDDTKEGMFGMRVANTTRAAARGARSSTPRGSRPKRNAGARNRNGSTISERSTAKRTASHSDRPPP